MGCLASILPQVSHPFAQVFYPHQVKNHCVVEHLLHCAHNFWLTGFDIDNIIATNGSDELLDMLIKHADGDIVISSPTFEMYSFLQG